MRSGAVLERGEQRLRAPVAAEERKRPLVERDDALVEIRTQHLEVMVLAAVVVQEEPLDTGQPVELEPFRQVVGVVAIDRAGR